MKDISVELSYILRHRPEKIGLSLEPGGWVLVDDLLTKLKLKKDVLDLIVKNNDKQRFEYSKDNIKIRARQGHSVKVDLGYKAEIPPVLSRNCIQAYSTKTIISWDLYSL